MENMTRAASHNNMSAPASATSTPTKPSPAGDTSATAEDPSNTSSSETAVVQQQVVFLTSPTGVTLNMAADSSCSTDNKRKAMEHGDLELFLKKDCLNLMQIRKTNKLKLVFHNFTEDD
jgi:hypothetical protein